MKILLIEDSLDIINGLKILLESEGYYFDFSTTIKDSKSKVDNCDLVILDISLPDGNGYDYFKDELIKKNKPVIFLTAFDDDNIVSTSLNIGAEDYVTKPFSNKELLARINKVKLRVNHKNKIKVKDIVYDIEKLEFYKNDKKIDLTSLETKILSELFINLNKTISRDYIIACIWSWTGNDVYDNTVTVYLKRIREKLDSDIIKTIKGIGYRIDE